MFLLLFLKLTIICFLYKKNDFFFVIPWMPKSNPSSRLVKDYYFVSKRLVKEWEEEDEKRKRGFDFGTFFVLLLLLLFCRRRKKMKKERGFDFRKERVLILRRKEF